MYKCMYYKCKLYTFNVYNVHSTYRLSVHSNLKLENNLYRVTHMHTHARANTRTHSVCIISRTEVS